MRRNSDRAAALGLLLLAGFTSELALANVGLPVVVVGFPFMLANLLVITAIEGFVIKRLWAGSSVAPVYREVFFANLVTTLLGYPAVAVLEACTALLGLNIGWFLPFQDLPQRSLYIGTMMTLTLVPCYFLSVWIEGKWLQRRLSPNITWRAVYLAHLASYAVLLLQAFTQFPMHLFDYSAFWAPFSKIF